MPVRLLDRCQENSIYEFREGAVQRNYDALRLAMASRRTGAIYLFGYSAEMVLKAASFSLIGFQNYQVISLADIRQGVMDGRTAGVPWPAQGSGHNILAWAEWLVLRRAILQPYPEPAFGREVILRSQRARQYWRETLRYHRNVAYDYELRQVREATEWLLAHVDIL